MGRYLDDLSSLMTKYSIPASLGLGGLDALQNAAQGEYFDVWRSLEETAFSLVAIGVSADVARSVEFSIRQAGLPASQQLNVLAASGRNFGYYGSRLLGGAGRFLGAAAGVGTGYLYAEGAAFYIDHALLLPFESAYYTPRGWKITDGMQEDPSGLRQGRQALALLRWMILIRAARVHTRIAKRKRRRLRPISTPMACEKKKAGPCGWST